MQIGTHKYCYEVNIFKLVENATILKMFNCRTKHFSSFQMAIFSLRGRGKRLLEYNTDIPER